MARKSRKNFQEIEMTVITAAVYDTWIYARISLDSDRAEDSVENQIAIAKAYISDKTDLALCGEITDVGFTGRDFERPGYAKLLEGIKSGTVKCVVVKDLSRLGRSYIDVGELLFDTLPVYGVRFISVNDQYDSFADNAARKKLLILFKNLINHMYSRDLGKKIRSAHAAKKQRGELTGQPPYGYMRSKDGKALIIDGEAAEVVKTVFNMRLAGVSANKIAKHLTREGVPSPQQRRYQLGQITHEKFAGRIVWPVGMVSKMLKNETYTGTLVQGKYDCDGKRHTLLPKEMWIRHENTHLAIISREQFEAVQCLMEETAAKYWRGKGEPLSENRYVGKIFCLRCGKAATRCSSGLHNRVRYYYCCRHCNYDLKAELNLNKSQQLSLAKLDAIVSATLQKQMDELIQADKLIEGLNKSGALSRKMAEFSREKSKWEKVVNNSDKTLSAAYIHHLDGLLDCREFEIVRTKAENDRREAEARLALANEELTKYDPASARNNLWREKYSAFRDFEIPSKELIQVLIGKITVTPLTNDVDIELNYMDSREELRSLFVESGESFDV